MFISDKFPIVDIFRFQILSFDHLTSTSVQDRISPFNVNTISSRQVLNNNLFVYTHVFYLNRLAQF